MGEISCIPCKERGKIFAYGVEIRTNQLLSMGGENALMLSVRMGSSFIRLP